MAEPGKRTRNARLLLEFAAKEIRADQADPEELGIAVCAAGDVLAALQDRSGRLGVQAPERLTPTDVNRWSLRLAGETTRPRRWRLPRGGALGRR